MRMEAMSDTAKRFDDLSPKTKEFLSELRDEEVETLKDGMRLVTATMIVGKFVKWCIVGVLGIAVGIVMFGESVAKIAAWLRNI